MPHAERPTHGRYGDKWHDQKAPDGFLLNGWRKVTKGGYIRHCGGKHFHEKFKDWAGLWVFAEINDGYGIDVNVWPDVPWIDSRTMLRCINQNDWEAAPTHTQESKA